MIRTLITAFEPITNSRRENASQAVLQHLKRRTSRHDSQHYDYLVLPVSANAPIILQNYADLIKPEAILSMGEDKILLPNAVRVEPYAHDCDATSNPIKGLFVPRIDSAFAKSTYPDTKNSTLLSWHCNAVFRAGLRWAEFNGNVPVAFAHVAVLGNRDTQTRKALTILEQLHQYHPVAA